MKTQTRGNEKPCVLPWKPRGASCCTSSETGGPSRGNWGCPSGPARQRGPLGRLPCFWCPVLTLGDPGWPLSRCCLRSYYRGRTWRAAWTVWSWAALREYASQQFGLEPPGWVGSHNKVSFPPGEEGLRSPQGWGWRRGRVGRSAELWLWVSECQLRDIWRTFELRELQKKKKKKSRPRSPNLTPNL